MWVGESNLTYIDAAAVFYFNWEDNLYVYFLMYQNLLISGEKKLLSAELKGGVT